MKKIPMNVSDRISLEKALRVQSVTMDEEIFLKNIQAEFYTHEYLTEITYEQRSKLKDIQFIHDQANGNFKFV